MKVMEAIVEGSCTLHHDYIDKKEVTTNGLRII